MPTRKTARKTYRQKKVTGEHCFALARARGGKTTENKEQDKTRREEKNRLNSQMNLLQIRMDHIYYFVD